jgi:hypothetical protein
VVLVITQHNLPEPGTDIGHAIMHPALKLNLDGFKLRNHSLLRRDPTYGEGSALVALPTVVGKAQEVKVSSFPSPRAFRSRAANRPNSISRVLSGCNSSPSNRHGLKNGHASGMPATCCSFQKEHPHRLALEY